MEGAAPRKIGDVRMVIWSLDDRYVIGAADHTLMVFNNKCIARLLTKVGVGQQLWCASSLPSRPLPSCVCIGLPPFGSTSGNECWL